MFDRMTNSALIHLQDEATYQAVPYQSKPPETAAPSVELTPEEVERKAEERRRRIRVSHH
jgi:hypothetical protein